MSCSFENYILFCTSSKIPPINFPNTSSHSREFPIRLENPHVISENQIWAGIVPVGPSGYSFNSSYRTRDSIEYKMELGNAIGM